MSLRYVIRRLGVFVLVIWAAATVNFIIPRLSPADPIKEALLRVTTMGAGQANMDVLAKTFAERFKLDQPVWKQYVNYLTDLVRGNLGYSIAFFPAQVNDMILTDSLFPPLTTVHVHHHKAGIEAARLIVYLIENAAAEARHIILPVELVVRGSTRSIHADNETMSRPREIKGRHT